MNARRSEAGFAVIAAAYTAVYAAAIAADHLTTLAVTAQGGVETNFLFNTTGGGLAESRAKIVFLALWPVLLGMIWLARRRAVHGQQAARLAAFDPLWGASAAGPLLLPATVVLTKLLAALLNLLVLFRLGSAPGLIRAALTPLGLAEPKLVYLATAGLTLAVSVAIARRLARLWAQRMARPRAVAA